MNTILKNVTRFVKAHLEILQDRRQRFESVFPLEKRLGARGPLRLGDFDIIQTPGLA